MDGPASCRSTGSGLSRGSCAPAPRPACQVTDSRRRTAALLARRVLVVIPGWRAGRGSSPPGAVGLIFGRRAGWSALRSVDDEPVTGGEADAASAEQGIDEHP